MTITDEAQPDTQTEPEPEILEPADVIEDTGQDVVLRSPSTGGVLTIRPHQRVLDEDQRAALIAIGINTLKDPQILPHIRPFIQLCQTRGLDPWLREAYLIGRGGGNNRKYTMQVGIDGYRKMALDTGRFVRVADILWTGLDDDDRSYYRDQRGVMRRVWYDQWPKSRGLPGAAKAVIEHLDERGNLTETEAVADFDMYAPYNTVYEGSGENRRPKRDANNEVVKELGEMWVKGGAFMLSKCSEALAYRRAFPARMSGFYVTEEMHRLDAQEADRERAEHAAARREHVRASRSPVAQPDESAADGPGPQEPAEPVVTFVEVSDHDRREWLLDELDWQSVTLESTIAAVTRRWSKAHRKNWVDASIPELQEMVAGIRPVVVDKMRADDGNWTPAQADAYAEIPAVVAVPRTALISGERPWLPADPTEAPQGNPEPEEKVDGHDE